MSSLLKLIHVQMSFAKIGVEWPCCRVWIQLGRGVDDAAKLRGQGELQSVAGVGGG